MKTLLYLQITPPVTRHVRSGLGRIYTPHKEVSDRLEVEGMLSTLQKEHLANLIECWPLPDNIAVQVCYCFGMPIPEHWSKTKKERALHEGHTTKPDRSNMDYFMDNRLEGFFLHNDKQISRVHVEKRYSVLPHILVYIGSFSSDTLQFFRDLNKVFSCFNEIRFGAYRPDRCCAVLTERATL